MSQDHAIRRMTLELQKRIRRNPLLNIDAFIIPSPYIKDAEISEDLEHSYVWIDEGEILGYMQVYSNSERRVYHIYKLVTSPFGRGRGIGRAFIEHLAANLSDDAQVYLYLWEKQPDTLEFFRSRGFNLGEQMVYRNRIYYLMYSTPKEIRKHSTAETTQDRARKEDIGKARHDARKTVRLISHMIESLSVENSGKIIEDINRETTTLVNILNVFRDTVNLIHEVNLKDLIVERIIPYIEASSVVCKIKFTLDDLTPIVLGYYVNFGRGLINIVSNSLEAIEESGRKGIIELRLEEFGDQLQLCICDNGIGIPQELLDLNDKGIPKFVGRSTKDRRAGEGLGTFQIYSAFGADHISVSSRSGRGTTWTIRFDKVPKGLDKGFIQLERRVHEFKGLLEQNMITAATKRTEVISYIWMLRKMELLLFDLILQFSKDHNIRVIYRTILAYKMGKSSKGELKREIATYRCQQPRIQSWVYDISRQLKERWNHLESVIDVHEYQGPLFRSYGQAEQVMIFTIDPENGAFLATDRKLAEHLDFVPYLNKQRDDLIRGELVGDINREDQPITLGIWSVSSDEDLDQKLKLLKQAARSLIAKGVKLEKRLAFYQTTYSRHTRDIDPDRVTTFQQFIHTPDHQLDSFTRSTDGFMNDYLHIVD